MYCCQKETHFVYVKVDTVTSIGESVPSHLGRQSVPHIALLYEKRRPVITHASMHTSQKNKNGWAPQVIITSCIMQGKEKASSLHNYPPQTKDERECDDDRDYDDGNKAHQGIQFPELIIALYACMYLSLSTS